MIRFFLAAVITALQPPTAAAPSPDISETSFLISCGDLSRTAAKVHLRLEVKLTNRSKEDVRIGDVYALQERYFSEDKDGAPREIRTGQASDEFGTPTRVHETVLPPDASKLLAFDHYVYSASRDVVQVVHGKRLLIVSFLIVNVAGDGPLWNYWTAPEHISIPDSCLSR